MTIPEAALTFVRILSNGLDQAIRDRDHYNMQATLSAGYIGPEEAFVAFSVDECKVIASAKRRSDLGQMLEYLEGDDFVVYHWNGEEWALESF